MLKGTVRWYDEEKGFGFIIPDSGEKDVYFHASNLETPEQGISAMQRVSYEWKLGKKGPEAIHVRML